MNAQVLVAGAGIGGLACALALARAGVGTAVIEQADAFGEVGAGLQLGPNAVRVLHDWGLDDALRAVSAFPDELRVRDAQQGHGLGRLRLGAHAHTRYGHAYATLHRADLHRLLLTAVQGHADVVLRQGARVTAFDAQARAVTVRLGTGEVLQAPALLGCDGLWSAVRAQLLGDGPPQPTGHLAWRGMVRSADLPEHLRANAVTAWLGPRHHLVQYPVRDGGWINLVAVVHGHAAAGSDARSWLQAAAGADLLRTLGPLCADLQSVLEAVPQWSLWQLHDRMPTRAATQMAQGRVALMGDAAHPMRPYLAQGAAMALEDAWTLGRLAASTSGASDPASTGWPAMLARYAQVRWARAARVQQRSQRNGRVFHADGWLRRGRNAAMALLGERLLDNHWLYAGPPDPSGMP